ncbi:MAG: hypothetical protein E7256_08420 [Lachnospiraceae bacterium]|nr:hypothetical protein [Lachnospiraceae bacterium]
MGRYLILIAGMPATGKATFAEYLSKKIGVPRACKDQVKEILFDQVGFRSSVEKRKLGIASNHLLYYMAEAQMRTGGNIILENVFHDREKEELNALAKKYSYEILTVLFQGQMDAVYQRYMEREMSPERHRGHAAVGYDSQNDRNDSCPPPIPLEEFREWIHSMGISEFSLGKTVLVDTTDFTGVDYPELVKQIEGIIANTKPETAVMQ